MNDSMNTSRLVIVGFSGLPIVGACGVKPAIVRSAETDKYAVLRRGQPGEWWTEDEMLEFARAGLVTLVSDKGDSSACALFDRAVVLYAHASFLRPRRDLGSLELVRLLVHGMFRADIEDHDFFYVVETVDAVRLRLDAWATALLESAERFLHIKQQWAQNGLAAWLEVLRARYTFAGRYDRSARENRQECRVIMSRAAKRCGKKVDEML